MSTLPLDLGKRFGNLNDLPAELREQLQIAKVGDLDQVIIDALSEEYGGIANLDEILVAIYRRTGVVQKRQYVSNKLYRMTKLELIHSVKGKKGVYRLRYDL